MPSIILTMLKFKGLRAKKRRILIFIIKQVLYIYMKTKAFVLIDLCQMQRYSIAQHYTTNFCDTCQSWYHPLSQCSFSPSCKNGCDLGTSSTFFVDKDKASDKTMNLSAVLRGKSFYQVRKFSISSIIIPILTPAVHIVTYFLIMFTSIHKNW